MTKPTQIPPAPIAGDAAPLTSSRPAMSRKEWQVLRDLTEPRTVLDRTRKLESAVERVADTIDRVPPVLLRVVAQETGLDLKSVAAGAREAVLDGVAPGGRRPSRRRPSPAQRF